MVNALLPCTACGTVNEPGTTSCSACGQSLVSTPVELSPSNGLLTSHRLLNDRYQIIDQVGAGGFGAVYKAADTRFGDRLVAIKEMAQKGLDAQEIVEAVASFKREALLLAHLQHPHLPRIYDHFSDAGRWYLVMDYIVGETLEDYLQKVPRDPHTGTRHLAVEEVLAIGIQLCTVLDYLHTRQPPIIFRDLKPANVMRTPDNHLYLIDFGIARHFKSGQIKDTMPLGSPGYAAPEQYGKRQTTSRADIYSLGVMLHQLLTGNDPANTPFRLAPLQYYGNTTLSQLEALIKQMVDLDEELRPASVALVKEELQKIATQQPHKRVWTLPPEAPQGGEYSSDTGTTGMGQQMAQQIQRERPQQEEQPVKRGPSRRAVVISLVGAAVVGGVAWNWLAKPKSTSVSVQPLITPITPFNPLTYTGHTDTVNSVAWSPNSQYIASASADSTVQVWDTQTGKNVLVYRGHTGAVDQAVWSPDGTKIASGSISEAVVQEWEASTGQSTFTYNTKLAYTNDIAWSPDGKMLAIGIIGPGPHEAGPPQKTDLVQTWDVTSHQIAHEYPSYAPEGIAWSPDAKALAVNSTFGETTIIDITTGDSSISHSGFMNSMHSVAWSPDGRYVASASDNGTVHIWEPKGSPQQAIRIFGNGPSYGPIYTVSWSPDGRRIAFGTQDGMIQVWNALTGNNPTIYTGHRGIVRSLQWSPNGKFIVSGGEDRTVRIWRV